MENKRTSYLLNKYVNGELTQEEQKELVALLDNGYPEHLLELIQKAMEDEPALAELSAAERSQRARILKKILAVDKASPGGLEIPLDPLPTFNLRKWLVAATVLLAVCFGGIYSWRDKVLQPKSNEVVSLVDASKPVNYVRYITLPDSSSVVLHAGSTLYYPEKFAKDSRQVRLEGEAYFDITHSKDSSGGDVDKIPFIIHTGELRTVVLGTAFTIKAYPKQRDVVVSVTRGKVRVEKANQVLAILTHDQQITYNYEGTSAAVSYVDAERTKDWAKADMEFDGVSFEKIAGTIEKRYGVEIEFKNPDLKSCMIVSSFMGTETLTNVLETLCMVRNATFSTESNKKITIDGSGCE